MEIALVHSLFGDGCAAALIRSHQPQDLALDNKFGICPIIGWESYVVPDSLHLMYTHWYETTDTTIDSRFLFVSTRELSYAVGLHLPIMINSFLARFHLTISDIKHWIIHSGGSKVNESVIYNLGLDHYQLRMTSKTIKNCGNVASASFLVSFTYLLEELNEKQISNRDDLGIFLTMGPGTGFECALFII
jgi:alkylresorcinol/alkylpyrone synthase/polyketide synthase Type III